MSATLVLVLLLVLGFGAGDARASDGVRVKWADGLDNGDRAFRVFVPADWQAQGGIVWSMEPCNAYGYNFVWQAEGPDGLRGAAILPMTSWSSAEDPITNCPARAFPDVRSYLTAVVSVVRPDARLLDFRPRPDLLTELQIPAPSRSFENGIERSSGAEAGEVLVAYVEKGQEVRAAVSGVITTWSLRLQGSFGQPDIVIQGGSAFPAWAVFAPSGQLDTRLGEAMRKSIVLDPQWSAVIADHRAKIDGINMKGISDRGRIMAESNREVGRIISEGYSARVASSDRMHRETIEAIRGVETYVDPTGGTVQLDHNYRQAWRLNDGTFFLTNDVNFQPFRDLGMDGTQLTVAP